MGVDEGDLVGDFISIVGLMVGDTVALFVGGVGGGKTPLSIEGGEVVIFGVGALDVDGVGLFSISPSMMITEMGYVVNGPILRVVTEIIP